MAMSDHAPQPLELGLAQTVLEAQQRSWLRRWRNNMTIELECATRSAWPSRTEPDMRVGAAECSPLVLTTMNALRCNDAGIGTKSCSRHTAILAPSCMYMCSQSRQAGIKQACRSARGPPQCPWTSSYMSHFW